ncbi:MAG: phenylalanyl-tRNA synthetase beta subunit, partial [Daejeonella sp.]|nr:phenylalanyl-tRNA synthetase beta subunit [Daejeonella sp.]
EAPMCIAGVFGGAESGVKESTTSVFLESAWFNSVYVRKTSKRHSLKTDASFRFERGTDPEMTTIALKRAALLIKEVAGGHISSAVSDFYPVHTQPFPVELKFKNVARLIGVEIPHQQITSIIKALLIEVIQENEEGLSLKVPAFKVDVTREVDVIEEILRIYGYNNIEIPTQIKASLNYGTKPDRELVLNQVADLLASNGFNEILSNSLTKSSYSEGSLDAVKILNPLSSDLDTMRQTLLYSGLEAIVHNQNRRVSDLKLFEVGKIYRQTDDKYFENQRLAIFISGNQQSENWSSKASSSNFYNLKAAVDAIISRLSIRGLISADYEGEEFEYGIQYRKGDKTLAKFGSVCKTILKKIDISSEVFYAEFDWDLLLKAISKNKIVYQEVSKFPSVRRDLSMLIDKSVKFDQLKQIALKTEKQLLKEINVFDVYEGNKLPEGKKSYALSFILQDEEKTLTDKQIDGIIQKLIYNFEKETGAEVRK